MGGSNFGINDTAWDDGGGMNAGGSSDWDKQALQAFTQAM
jgi:hypothetical protein